MFLLTLSYRISMITKCVFGNYDKKKKVRKSISYALLVMVLLPNFNHVLPESKKFQWVIPYSFVQQPGVLKSQTNPTAKKRAKKCRHHFFTLMETR